MESPPDDNERLTLDSDSAADFDPDVSPQSDGGGAEQPTPVARFGAGKAIASFLLLLISQVLVGIAVIVLTLIVAVVRGENIADEQVMGRLLQDTQAVTLLAASIASVLVVYLIARLWAWPLVLDRSANGIGFRPAPYRYVAAAAGVGVVLGVCYLSVVQWLVPFDPTTPIGPLAAAAKTGGATRLAWAVLALIIAPVVEEFFFRGLLLKGFVTTWGVAAGSAAATILFISLHLLETFAYWPATVAITVMALVTLGARVVTGSLVPAIAAHIGYNAIIVAAVYAAS
ncbi:MAG TPA: CPBP family intramembrane glutamic endopeptidase [Thermoanaerobaculia bacterium]|jgi:hypothetical protein